MVILFVVSTLKRSGPTNQLYNLIKYLDRSSVSAHVLTLSPEPDDSRWYDFKSLGISLHSLSLSRFEGFLKGKSRLLCLIDKVKPDLIHSQGARADIVTSKLRVNVAKLCTIHNFPQEDYIFSYGKIKGSLLLKEHLKAFRKIDCCVCISKPVEVNMHSRFSLYNTCVIKNGIDNDCFYSVSRKKKVELREELDLPVSSEIWVSAGHLSKLKDPVFLINFWLKSFKNDMRKVLVLVGDGPLFDYCVGLSSGSKNIVFAGRVSDVSIYLQASDFYITASRSEGFSLSLAEALFCQLRVVSSRIGAHEELLKIDGSLGDVFELYNEEELINAISRVIDIDGKVDFPYGRVTSSEINAKNMAVEYMNVYERLCQS